MSNGLSALSQPILIVDDVASEAMTLDLLFQSLGVETIRAASAAEAGDIPDLVMPGADGMDCLFMIAGCAPTVPVMVVTASERLLLKAAGELGETYGLSDLTCIAKPLDVATLAAFITRAGAPIKPTFRNLN